MSKYNYYAKDLNDLFAKTRESYKEALANLEAARMQYKSQIADTKNGSYSNARSQAMATLAREDLKTAEDTYTRTCKAIESEYRARAAELKKALGDQLSSDSCLRAKDIDSNALALLNSGLMGVGDFEAMSTDFAGNPTMRKIIKTHLEKLSFADPAERQRQSLLLADMSTNDIQKDFDKLLDCANTYSGIKSGKFADASASGYIAEMMDNWDKAEDIRTAIDEF